jgi:ubiquinone/menaquinone biosynthesis C-methylase UbiE
MIGIMQNNELNNIKLHIGCGNNRLEEFINIDIIESEAVDKIMDARKIDFPDKSVSTIYTSHVIEHFPHGEVPLVLEEWNRVLKDDGRLIVVAPNFDRYVDWYISRKPFSFIKYYFFYYLLGFPKIESDRPLTDNFIADVTGGALFPKIDRSYETYHKVIFNPESLRTLARNAGFKKAERIDLKKDLFPIAGVNPKDLHWSSMAFIFYKN